MANTTDQNLSDVLSFLVTGAAVAIVLALLLRGLRRSRPGLDLAGPTAVAMVIRVAMAAAVSLTAYGATLRGGDEVAFLFRADRVMDTPFGAQPWTDALTHELHVFLLAAQRSVLDSPDLALRVTEAGIAVAGIVLLATAVYELAGGWAARVSAWLLAFEPASVFFSTLIHKESLILLAVGLVALGGARIWRTGRFGGLAPILAGCLIAGAVRGYISWFLIAAAAAITLHAALRTMRTSAARAWVAIGAVVVLSAFAIPLVTGQFADQNLHRLDVSQSANARDTSNLQLEAVDFSSGTAIVTNLPTRIAEVTFRPYPWELANVSQQLGLLGTLAVLLTLGFLVREIVRNWGHVFASSGPLIYVGTSLLIAYSLAAGNAGTAFRYRTQILAVALSLVVTLAAQRRPASVPTRTDSDPMHPTTLPAVPVRTQPLR